MSVSVTQRAPHKGTIMPSLLTLFDKSLLAYECTNENISEIVSGLFVINDYVLEEEIFIGLFRCMPPTLI